MRRSHLTLANEESAEEDEQPAPKNGLCEVTFHSEKSLVRLHKSTLQLQFFLPESVNSVESSSINATVLLELSSSRRVLSVGDRTSSISSAFEPKTSFRKYFGC